MLAIYVVAGSLLQRKGATTMNTKLMEAVGDASDLLKDRGLSETDLHVLLAVASGAEDTGQVFVGRKSGYLALRARLGREIALKEQ
jgi:hypothetical protein